MGPQRMLLAVLGAAALLAPPAMAEQYQTRRAKDACGTTTAWRTKNGVLFVHRRNNEGGWYRTTTHTGKDGTVTETRVWRDADGKLIDRYTKRRQPDGTTRTTGVQRYADGLRSYEAFSGVGKSDRYECREATGDGGFTVTKSWNLGPKTRAAIKSTFDPSGKLSSWKRWAGSEDSGKTTVWSSDGSKTKLNGFVHCCSSPP